MITLLIMVVVVVWSCFYRSEAQQRDIMKVLSDDERVVSKLFCRQPGTIAEYKYKDNFNTANAVLSGGAICNLHPSAFNTSDA